MDEPPGPPVVTGYVMATGRRSRRLRALSIRRAAIPLAVIAITLAASSLLVFHFRERVTRANFDRIEIGMTKREGWQLLGRPPTYSILELGRVHSPDSYSEYTRPDAARGYDRSWFDDRVPPLSDGPETEARDRGFRDYRRQQWTSREIAIIVIFDMDRRVACRYSGEGSGDHWLEEFLGRAARLIGR